MKDITEIIEEIVERIRVAYDVDNVKPYFFPGNAYEVATLIQQQQQIQEYSLPCIILAHNIQTQARKSKDSWIDSEVDITIVICAETMHDYTIQQRNAATFETILEPIETLFKSGLFSSVYLDNYSERDTDITRTKHHISISTLLNTDVNANWIDAIELNIRGLRIKSTACGDARNVVDMYPTITINGTNPTAHQQLTAYTDAGATAVDYLGNSVAVTASGIDYVDTNTVGNYTITYSATDSQNLTTTAERIVVVYPSGCEPTPDGIYIVEESGEFIIED